MDINKLNEYLLENQSTLLLVATILVIFLIKNFIGGSTPTKKPTTTKSQSSTTKKTTFPAKGDPPVYYTAEQVSVHNKKDDLWLIIEDKVYDVTEYVEKHMGGLAIMNNAGKDSTVGFKGDQHPVKVKQILDEFYIGELKK
ncbi:hypothetical protein DLAC_03281 [Tieghemostelium lacteum]|uniref:Cytochrome b5 heme-binding domain-containing protein n=1 Tax=Tieghemostelium lacteum TaxID=361077 RepID=A0A152A1Q5_TIELA|nr:hypothetical protein DLAC_03281 [Tieghemostelium lacteum]|eukprot:KYR00129.1 hypothetical protein DLAC_03281 [Tieghemostelium lacteum]